MPATEAYRTPVDHWEVVPASPTPPILVAALPKRTIWEETKEVYTQLTPGPVATTPHVLVSDTVVKDTLPPVLSGKPDPTTTIVNSLGGVVATLGIGVVIANSGEPPKTEWGGLSQLILFLVGLVIALIGLGLLFFQGKNGRLRRLREARKAAAATSPDLNPNDKASQNHKTGFGLMVAGGAVGLLGFLVSGYFLLLLPVGIILLLVGAVFSITSH